MAATPAVRLREFFDGLYGEPGVCGLESIPQALFRALRLQFPFSSGFFLQFDPSDWNVTTACTYGLTMEDMRPYNTHYCRLDPYRIHLPNLKRPNEVVRVSDFTDEAKLLDTEFGEAMRMFDYFHSMAIAPFVRGMPVGAFAVHRPRQGQDFTCREQAVFRWCATHAARAMDYRRLAAHLRQPGPATIVVSPAEQRILSMTDEALNVLAGIPDGSAFALPADPEHTRLWLAAGHAYAVRTQDLGSDSLWQLPAIAHLSFTVVPIRIASKLHIPLQDKRERALVVIERLENAEQARGKLTGLGLSPRQRQVAYLMVLGRGLKEIARLCGISPNTAKEYAAEVYRRLGVHARSEFLAKLTGMAREVHRS